ncbi:UPF0489 family protein [Pontibacillus chungwhensis]|nr:UPF0489 family protein [Pontibacillus chungwhensis]
MMKVLGDDLDGVIYFKDKSIYIMDDHSWAFFAWEFERLKGNVNGDSALLHFDNHLDDVPDRIDVNGLKDAQTKEDLISLIASKEERRSADYSGKISIDNFIWPSFVRGTLGSMYIISPHKQESLVNWLLAEEEYEGARKDDFFQYIPKEKIEKVKRVYTFDEFDLGEFNQLAQNNSKILNIDLDYFNESDDLFEPSLMRDNKVKGILEQLMNACKWDLITVAISPLYCGGEPEARHLLQLFIESAGISMEEGVSVKV